MYMECIMNVTVQEQETLVAHALEARKTAYCPHSNYAVGAAVLTSDNHIVTAANVEAVSSTLHNCAERIALANAFLQGHRKIKALAMVTEDGQAPCGTCRQIIYELCPNVHIIIAKTDKTYITTSIAQLLPAAFKRATCGS